MIAFGENILLWRLYKSLSQEQLASLSGIPRPNLSDIEKGKRDVTLTTIRLLANALGMLPGTLVNGEPPEHKNRRKKISRDFMERIAVSVVHGRTPENPSERQICQLLKEVLNCRILSARTRKGDLPLPTRKGGHAWLLLRALYPSETLNSLIARTVEKAEIEWTKDR